MERKQLLEEVTELLDYYCSDCFVKKRLIKKRAKHTLRRFVLKSVP